MTITSPSIKAAIDFSDLFFLSDLLLTTPSLTASVLHLCSWKGFEDGVRLCLEIDPQSVRSVNESGLEAVQLASSQGNEGVVLMLEGFGVVIADLHGDGCANTPLRLAARWGQVEVVKVLVERLCAKKCRLAGMDALAVAIKFKHWQVAKLLIKFLFDGRERVQAEEELRMKMKVLVVDLGCLPSPGWKFWQRSD
jgi:hypothetical protein